MIAIPAIDVQAGTHVLRMPGSGGRAVSRLGDPVAAARELARQGFTRLHVADLDAAAGRGANDVVVRDLLREWAGDVQFAGALSSTDDLRTVLDDGARYVVVDTRAADDLDAVSEQAAMFPDEVIVSMVVRDRRAGLRRGLRVHEHNVMDLIDDMVSLPLAGILVRLADRAGRAQGPDLALLEDVAEAAGTLPVFAAGGVASVADLRALDDRGIAGVVIATALHTGLLNPWLVSEEFVA